MFLAPLAWPFSGAVCSFRLLLLVPLCTKCNKLVLCFFAALLLSFLMSFWACCGCCFFLFVSPRDHACQTMPPLCPSIPRFAHYPFPSVPQHPHAPFQHMRVYLHSLHSRTHGYLCARVCSCFCVFVARTVCVRMPVLGLAGVSVLVFCVFLCVCGCPVRLRIPTTRCYIKKS